MQVNLRILLTPASVLYSMVMKLRAYLYSKSILNSYQSDTPIISVGNVSIGGNGKTPLCIYLANLLEKQGYEPIILLKGYGGKLKGPLLANNSHTAEELSLIHI